MTTVIHARGIELLGQMLAAIADEIETPGGEVPPGGIRNQKQRSC